MWDRKASLSRILNASNYLHQKVLADSYVKYSFLIPDYHSNTLYSSSSWQFLDCLFTLFVCLLGCGGKSLHGQSETRRSRSTGREMERLHSEVQLATEMCPPRPQCHPPCQCASPKKALSRKHPQARKVLLSGSISAKLLGPLRHSSPEYGNSL